MRAFKLLTIFSIVSATSFAQEKDSIANKIELYGKRNSAPVLFLHFDKTIYTSNEEVWFTGYLLNADPTVAKQHRTLSLTLVRGIDRKIVAQKNFVMDAGLCFGNISVPDSSLTGNYVFVAYTDRVQRGLPEVVFEQPVVIKTLDQPKIALSLKLIDTSKNSEVVKTQLIARSDKSILLIGAPVKYTIGNSKKPAFTLRTQTDVTGGHILNIDRKLLTAANHTLRAEVQNGKATEFIKLPVPIKNSKPLVKFYPEGGSMVLNLGNRIAWEVTNAVGGALKATGILYKNDKVIDTIGTDSFGMGTFYLEPEVGAKYGVGIIQNGKVDTTYQLPQTLTHGVVISVPEALPKDTLAIRLYSTERQTYRLIAHDYKKDYLDIKVATSARGRSIKIAADLLPKGLITLTLLDSLDRPCAERVIFGGYAIRPVPNIITDKQEYVTRERVNVKLKFQNDQRVPNAGTASVACVQDNRLSVKTPNNIERYYYLQHDLQNMPLIDGAFINDELHRNYLNELLLVRGWSRYTWADLMRTTMADSIPVTYPVAYKGRVLYADKKLKKNVGLTKIMGVKFDLINTDNTGGFTLSDDDLLSQPDKNIYLLVNGANKNLPYKIKYDDPFAKLSKLLVDTLDMDEDETIQGEENNTSLTIKEPSNATKLKEVKIKSVKDESLYITEYSGRQANECGDYVCTYNILNCPNHRNDPGNTEPVKGMTYFGGVIYSGCKVYKKPGEKDEHILKLDGIYTQKEFYVTDYSDPANIAPDHQSTIFWKHSVILNKNGEAELSFFTSDITGKYRVVIQGVTNEGLVYGEAVFNVKNKQ